MTVRSAAMTPPLLVFMASSRLRREPYRVYRMIQRFDPVHESPLGIVVLSRHADVDALLRSPVVSSNETHVDLDAIKTDRFNRLMRRPPRTAEDGPLFQVLSRVMLAHDAPDHTRLRGLAAKAFTPSRVRDLEGRIEGIVDDLLGAVAARRSMELMHDFAYPLPARVICELLGVPAADSEMIAAHASALATGFDPPPMRTHATMQAADDATQAMCEYLEVVIAARRRQPGDDLLSHLLEAEEDGDRLSHDELVGTLFLLLFAGHETTANLIGNGMVALLRHPAQLALLRADSTHDATAVEELLRFESPVQMLRRVTIDDLTVGDRTIPAGRIVVGMIGAANRDPAVFERPEELDVTRAPNPHLAFATGPHFCLGAALARLEGRIAIGALARRLPGVRASGPSRRRASFTIRGLEQLPLAW